MRICVTLLYANLYHTPFIIIHNLSNVTMVFEMVKILSASTKKLVRVFASFLTFASHFTIYRDDCIQFHSPDIVCPLARSARNRMRVIPAKFATSLMIKST